MYWKFFSSEQHFWLEKRFIWRKLFFIKCCFYRKAVFFWQKKIPGRNLWSIETFILGQGTHNFLKNDVSTIVVMYVNKISQKNIVQSQIYIVFLNNPEKITKNLSRNKQANCVKLRKLWSFFQKIYFKNWKLSLM